MHDRTCAACGSRVGVLLDQCPACGSDPDLQLIELGVGGPGRRRRGSPPPTGRNGTGPRRRIGWRQWAPVAATVLALWGFLVATSGGGGDGSDTEQADDEPTTTTRKRAERTPGTRRGPRATTTTTLLLEGQPLQAEGAPSALVMLGDRNLVIDLNTGIARGLHRDASVWGASGGRLLVSEAGELAWWPAPYDGEGAEHLGVRDVDQAWIEPGSTRIWYARSRSPAERRVVLVDAAASVEYPLPPDAWPVGAVVGGVILNAPGGAFLLEDSGDVSQLSTGSAIGVGANRLLVARCEGALECGLESVGLDGRVLERREAPALGNASYVYGPSGFAAYSVDGRLAQIVEDDDGAQVLGIDGEVVNGIPADSGIGPAAWSNNGRWLFAGTAGDGVFVIDAESLRVVAHFDDGRNNSSWQLVVVDR